MVSRYLRIRWKPRLSNMPMGFVAAPAIAQGAHESVLYGAEGAGSDEARALAPALDPASRLSSRRQPEIDTPAAKKLHVIVIYDVLCFRQVPITSARHAEGVQGCGAHRAA